MVFFFAFFFVLLVVGCGLLLWRARRRASFSLRRKRQEDAAGGIRRTQAKPPWVKREVVRLKALMPDDGCRTIAAVFNRVHGNDGVTVGKTFVNTAIGEHRYEIIA